jgi:hypothetical protein
MISKGVAKRVAYKKEGSGWGVLAGAASGKYIRRVTSDFNLTKDTYESGEIRTGNFLQAHTLTSCSQF